MTETPKGHWEHADDKVWRRCMIEPEGIEEHLGLGGGGLGGGNSIFCHRFVKDAYEFVRDKSEPVVQTSDARISALEAKVREQEDTIANLAYRVSVLE